jgi:long-chain fatty acid transport protein
MKKIITLSLLSSTLLLSSGYRLPESSLNATALSAAYIANAYGADAAYYNPANMALDGENAHQVEGALTYIHLSKTKYTDYRNPAFNSRSRSEDLAAPSLFYVSPEFNNLRYGASLTVPGGLTKRWNSPFAKTFAQEFTLKIIEFNPVLAYKVSDTFAVGGGLRVIYSEGIVKSDGSGINKPAIRDMEAQTTEYGYNLALSYKPLSNLTFSSTYRSNVDINEEGNAKLYLSGTKLYDGGASIEVPLPAVAAFAVAYTMESTTVEFVYDRTFWSAYENLDFKFKDDVPVALKSAFDDPKKRDWEDSNAFRLGVTQNFGDLTLMGSIAVDKNPVPSKNLGFELPDSDAVLYAGGFRYYINSQLSLGASVLYDKKESRRVNNGEINGKFKDASAVLVTTGLSYKF